MAKLICPVLFLKHPRIFHFLLGIVFFLTAGPTYAGGPEFAELMDAVSQQNLARVQAILENPDKLSKINLNEKREGWTPLCLAVVKGNSEVVRLLLGHGASLSVGFVHQGREYSPFMLAAQTYRADSETPNVIQRLLERFQSEDYAREIQSTFLFKQPELRSQLQVLHNTYILKTPETASCNNAPETFPNDLQAQSYQALDIACAICMEVPGDADKTKLLNGSLRTGDSTKCLNCGSSFCKTCLDKWVSSKNVYGAHDNQSCPNCRTAIPMGNYGHQVEITRNLIPEFTQWKGDHKVPYPGQPIAQVRAAAPQVNRAPVVAVRPPALAQQPLPVQNQASRQEFVEVQGRLVKLHRVFRIDADPNAVWTEPLRVVQNGQLTSTVVEMDYNTLMHANSGCFALNPERERQAILQEVNQERAPLRGCYPPLKVDFERFRTARGYGIFAGYSSPGNIPNMDRWFRSASPRVASNAWDFNGGDGDIGDFNRGYRGAVLCRCAGPAW